MLRNQNSERFVANQEELNAMLATISNDIENILEGVKDVPKRSDSKSKEFAERHAELSQHIFSQEDQEDNYVENEENLDADLISEEDCAL